MEHRTIETETWNDCVTVNLLKSKYTTVKNLIEKNLIIKKNNNV